MHVALDSRKLNRKMQVGTNQGSTMRVVHSFVEYAPNHELYLPRVSGNELAYLTEAVSTNASLQRAGAFKEPKAR